MESHRGRAIEALTEVKQRTPSITIASPEAAARFFDTHDVALIILELLPPRDLLDSCRVRKSFNDLTKNTSSLRQKLFLEKFDESDSYVFYEWNEVAMSLYKVLKHEIEEDATDLIPKYGYNPLLIAGPLDDFTDSIDNRAEQRTEEFRLVALPASIHADALCRDMFISHPPATTATLSHGRQGSFEDIQVDEGIRFKDVLRCFEVDLRGPHRGWKLADMCLEMPFFRLDKLEVAIFEANEFIHYKYDVEGELCPTLVVDKWGYFKTEKAQDIIEKGLRRTTDADWETSDTDGETSDADGEVSGADGEVSDADEETSE